MECCQQPGTRDEMSRRGEGGTSNMGKLGDAFKSSVLATSTEESRQIQGTWPLFLWLQRPVLLEYNYDNESQQRPAKRLEQGLAKPTTRTITALSDPHILYHDWQSRGPAVAHPISPIILAFGSPTRVIHLWKQRNTRCRSSGNGTRL